ncbi:hypothetical protein D7D52_32325 [Nocardia yunnanensis]|uniref:Uncharacterized protein n=1 Tax=Nocardia yunnanensis TaxID=2382165 RepID=A0A386ZMC2_9NOCA|nr:hypothetical protein [Nocardia yunnanensis]AYF77725.1 hypothetical protein D7D52_32325 [Nocardia yunnanensis]
MVDITTVFPAGTEGDHAEQARLVREADRDLGVDTAALHPLAERIRAAFDNAAVADLIDQNTITPRPREHAWLDGDWDDDWEHA